MLKTLKCDFGRIIVNRAFLAAITVTAVLCFSTQIYFDASNGREYSVFEALCSFDRGFMAEKYQFYPPVIIKQTLLGYSSIAMPITASFPFVFSFVTERNSTNMRLSVLRSGRRKYYLSKFFSALISGGLCTMLGVMIFGVFAFALFPSTQSPETISGILPDGVFMTLMGKALSAFVYGMTSVLTAFFLCSFCANPYIILCVPFLLKFILETLLSHIQTNAAAAGDYGVYDRTRPFFPNSASLLFSMEVNKTFFEVLVVNLLFAAAVFAGFVLIMEKRADRGS
ncbi:MAG: hypothetical protein J1F28_06970 [Oscillospiraceae bacterium]|nr:hypothetical protein [Oscillospiraceae bacterium]